MSYCWPGSTRITEVTSAGAREGCTAVTAGVGAMSAARLACSKLRKRVMHAGSSFSRKSIVPEICACMAAPPKSSLETSCPIAAFTSAGPARYRPLPSVINSVSHSTGKYPPPATQLPMMAAYCGMPMALNTALLRKIRPKSSVSGNTSSCKGKNTPALSTKYRSGNRARSAITCARMIFLQVIGKNAPAFTVASLAMIITSRPCTVPMPVITPAAGAPPYSRYMFHAANNPSSVNAVPASTSSAMRSRAVNRPCRCWRSMPEGPPPCSILALSAMNWAIAP